VLVVLIAVLLWRPLAAWWGDTNGNRALLRGDQERAQAYFEWALRLEPTWALLHEDLGRALLQTNPQDALREFDIAACGAACTAEAGDALVHLGRLDEAIDRYISAKAVSRVSEIALSLAQRGEYERATELTLALIGKLHDKFLERADLASAYATLGKIDLDAAAANPARARELRRAAIAAYASASRLASFNEGYMLSYAFAQMQYGDAAAARRAFERVLELHPHQRDAEAALAHLAPDFPETMPSTVP
jgi:tetratricopeptide (TPR) repeat protein